MMKWCEKILIAINGGSSGHHLLRESIRLAHWIRAEMTLVHAVPPYNGDLTFAGAGSIEELRREPCRQLLDRVTEITEENHAFLKAICLEGEPAEIILETAQKESCDLVVMGVYPKNIINRIISGRTLKKVMTRMRKNMMIFPPDTSLEWKKILLITDNDRYSELADDMAGKLARGYGGELIRTALPDIFRKSAGLNRAMRSHQTAQSRPLPIEKAGPDRQSISYKSCTPRQIIQTAQQQKVNLIIMPAPEASGFSLFRIDAFERFLSSLPCPALICGVGS
jgi:nucleotide-binding universal stress UspA family protein